MCAQERTHRKEIEGKKKSFDMNFEADRNKIFFGIMR